MVLLSDTNALHFESIEQNHPEILELFDGRIVLSFREGFTKPDHRIYSRALEVAGEDYNFTDCLYVDDNLENVTAAVQLGMIGHHYVGLYEFVTKLRQLDITLDLR
jgi:HAD superfamily hydrolase (TIGR01509 family)